jgi:hypothetical protein
MFCQNAAPAARWGSRVLGFFRRRRWVRRSAGLAQMGDAGYEKLTDIRKAPHGFHG